MATSYKGKWNKYPECITTPEDKEAYRRSLLIPCFNCRMTIPIWNKDFITIKEDGQSENTMDDVNCPRCGARVSFASTVELPQ